MTPINETKSTYNGREVYAQTSRKPFSCKGCALEDEPTSEPCRRVGPCGPSMRADRTDIIWVYAGE